MQKITEEKAGLEREIKLRTKENDDIKRSYEEALSICRNLAKNLKKADESFQQREKQFVDKIHNLEAKFSALSEKQEQLRTVSSPTVL